MEENLLKLPISAVSSGHDDIVGDQGASAEAGSVQEKTDLVGELSRPGEAAANDLAVVDGRCLYNVIIFNSKARKKLILTLEESFYKFS